MNDPQERYIPVDPDGTSSDPRPQTYFIIRALLSSRVELGIGSDEEQPEEDVNIYLAHLLSSYADARYQQRVGKYLCSYDSGVFQQIHQSTSDRLKYTVYKANADHLLMLIGVFRNPSGQAQGTLPPLLQVDPATYLGRGKAYYDYAETYGRSLFGRESAIPAVLSKLSAGFEAYVRLLGHVRSEHFNLIDKLSEGELYHLKIALECEDRSAIQNEFLDAYNDYRSDPSSESRARLLTIARRLQALDPDFSFELPDTPE